MDNHEKTLPSSYQQASKESLDDNYKDKSVDVSFKSKQMLSDDENNSTKEALDQVNPNTNPQQFVQMSPVVITNPPTTSINQAQETNWEAYYCNQCRTSTDVDIRVTNSQCTYIWACVLCCFASPLLTCVPFCMSSLKENTVYCRKCQKPIKSTQKNRTRANIILTIALLIGFTVSVLILWQALPSNRSYGK